MTKDRFEKWWDEEGSGTRPINGHDHEEHVRRMCQIAWANGEYVGEEIKEK